MGWESAWEQYQNDHPPIRSGDPHERAEVWRGMVFRFAYEMGYEAAAQEHRAAIREALAALRSAYGLGDEALVVILGGWVGGRTHSTLPLADRLIAALAALAALAGEEATQC
jgi:hypothetical protein